MQVTLLYKTDVWHSYASRDLIAVFTCRRKMWKAIKKIINDNQWNNPRDIETKDELKTYIKWNIDFFMEKGQTQGLDGFELHSECIDVNKIL